MKSSNFALLVFWFGSAKRCFSVLALNERKEPLNLFCLRYDLLCLLMLVFLSTEAP